MTGPQPPPRHFAPLETICKNRFPFALACPSFVYPAGYVDNVRHLAPFVDEIELLFFESRFADSRPSRTLVRELAELGSAGGITYNVHLPTDIDLGHEEAGIRLHAVNVLKEVIERCAPLNPTTFTLHLVHDPADPGIERWQDQCVTSLAAVLAGGIPSRRISVENIGHDFAPATPVIEQLDMSVCMDMGHLMAHGQDVAAFYERWRERITIAHLHGVDGARDHLPLDRLSKVLMVTVLALLQRFAHTVCLEVYSPEALNASLRHLANEWNGLKVEGPR
jgi:sugar phosphate isomerase/epimerase